MLARKIMHELESVVKISGILDKKLIGQVLAPDLFSR